MAQETKQLEESKQTLQKSERTFPIKYDLKVTHGSFTKEEVEKSGVGGADGLLFLPCNFEVGDDRLKSHEDKEVYFPPSIFSMNKEGARMSCNDLFNIAIFILNSIEEQHLDKNTSDRLSPYNLEVYEAMLGKIEDDSDEK